MINYNYFKIKQHAKINHHSIISKRKHLKPLHGQGYIQQT